MMIDQIFHTFSLLVSFFQLNLQNLIKLNELSIKGII